MRMYYFAASYLYTSSVQEVKVLYILILHAEEI